MLAIFPVAGCAGDPARTPDLHADQRDISKHQVLIKESLSYSPFYTNLKHRFAHADYVVDNVERDGFIIAVGEDFPDHFTRWATLKVYRSGAVARLVTDDKGDESWNLKCSWG